MTASRPGRSIASLVKLCATLPVDFSSDVTVMALLCRIPSVSAPCGELNTVKYGLHS